MFLWGRRLLFLDLKLWLGAPAMADAMQICLCSLRHEVVVGRPRVNWVCYGERLRHDPTTDALASVFSCSRNPERNACVGCRVCTTCGDLRCTCGLLSISMG